MRVTESEVLSSDLGHLGARVPGDEKSRLRWTAGFFFPSAWDF